MIERVVENWLTKVNERSLEVPFCQLLTAEGYQVVHLSRHGPLEEGKDVLAIAPDRIACAFQLKGAPNGSITQADWEEECGQITRLVEVPIMHPSIDRDLPRHAYLVTNGDLAEEVRVEISHRNLDWERRGLPVLETIVKGQLLTRFIALSTDLWPMELASEMTLLELFLADGTGCLNKGNLAGLLTPLLLSNDVRLTNDRARRNLASAAMLTTYALSPYEHRRNHVAVIEGWMVYLACLAALAERHGFDRTCWGDALAISVFAIEQAFTDLCDELKTRKSLSEGNALVEGPFYRPRVTWLVGLVSAFALWKRLRNPVWVIDDWFRSFVNTHQPDLLLWGEAAVPQFLAMFWLLSQTSGTCQPDGLLLGLIKSICHANLGKNSPGLPDPYHDILEVLSAQVEPDKPPRSENYRGRSYTLEALVHLVARRGWRQQLRWLWPDITRLHYAEFQPVSPWQFCLHTNEEGRALVSLPKRPQSWAELQKEAASADTRAIPQLLQEHPELLLLLILTYPHRLTKDVAKFLDDRFGQLR